MARPNRRMSDSRRWSCPRDLGRMLGGRMSRSQVPGGRIRRRSVRRAVALALGLFALGAHRVTRADGPADEDSTADRVLGAVKSNDSGALREIATRDDPDPWVVADVLVGRGEAGAAKAYAFAAKRA